MALATRGNLVWLGMILAGMALGAFVLTSWPDTSTRLIRLPYGESMPKTPRMAAKAPAVTVARPAPATPKAQLIVAEPAPKPATQPARAPAAAAPANEAPVDLVSEETPTELGAEPLPGMGQSKPVEKQSAPAPTQAAPAAQGKPAPAPEEPPAIEITVGSPPLSGQE